MRIEHNIYREGKLFLKFSLAEEANDFVNRLLFFNKNQKLEIKKEIIYESNIKRIKN